MVTAIRFPYLLVLIVLLHLPGCGDDSSTNPQTLQPSTSLMVDRLVISVVPTGSEIVIVNTTDGEGNAGSFVADVADPSIASLSTTETEILITGIDYGRTNMTITTSSGEQRVIPITVYNHIDVDFGEIRLMYWTRFGDPRGYGYPPLIEDDVFYFYHPEFLIGQMNWRAFGSLLLRHGEDPASEKVMLIVKADEDADPTTPPLIAPSQYIYDTYIDMGQEESQARFYWPEPPEGYCSLGVVAMYRTNQPSTMEAICVRQDLVHFGELDGNPAWTSPLYFEDDEFHYFEKMVPIAAPPHEKAYIPVGTFSYTDEQHHEQDPHVNVLAIDLPLIGESEEQQVIPQLVGFFAPPDQSLPTQLRVILTPYNTVTDPDYVDREDWQIANSPFYRVEREVYYKLKYFNYNQTSVIQENQLEIVSGTVASNSELFWEESGISVTKEAGIMIGKKNIANASGKYTANVSRKLGYATMTNVQELREEHTTTTVFTPPGKAAAMWQKYNRFTLKRHVENRVEVVSIYEFGINEFITDEFPNEGATVEFVSDAPMIPSCKLEAGLTPGGK